MAEARPGAAPAPPDPRVQALLALQRGAGNAATVRLMRSLSDAARKKGNTNTQTFNDADEYLPASIDVPSPLGTLTFTRGMKKAGKMWISTSAYAPVNNVEMALHMTLTFKSFRCIPRSTTAQIDFESPHATLRTKVDQNKMDKVQSATTDAPMAFHRSTNSKHWNVGNKEKTAEAEHHMGVTQAQADAAVAIDFPSMQDAFGTGITDHWVQELAAANPPLAGWTKTAVVGDRDVTDNT